MSEFPGLVVLLILGPGFLALGIKSLRAGSWRDSVPLAEVVIDRALGVDPPPRNTGDQRLAHLQAWLFTLFGSFFSLCLLAVIYSHITE